MATMTLASCLLPPEGPRLPVPDFPPQIAFGSIRPEQPFLRIRLGDSCRVFEAEIPDIRDQDSRDLVVRWVVNNNLPFARLLVEAPLPPLEPGSRQESSLRVVVAEDLDADGSGLAEGETVVLSFFVTDADRFALPRDTMTRGEARDFGAIPEGSGATVEARWTFTFGEVGVCP